MASQPLEVLRDLGNGLIVRRGRLEDSEVLAELNARIHSDDGPEHPDELVRAWTRDLLSGQHPTFVPGDFTIVEEAHSGQIVSSLCLIDQTWSYAGIQFGVGRPELVGTLPEYRQRGLVRLQFDILHAWSVKRGQKVQAITGIPYYYRQFGYEMCLNLGGLRAGYASHVPRLAQDESEPCIIRPVEEGDLDWILETYRSGMQRSLVRCEWDRALLHYEVFVKSPKQEGKLELRAITSLDGTPLGFFGYPLYMRGDMQVLNIYELRSLRSGAPWWQVTPCVVRYLWQQGEARAAALGQKLESFGLQLGESHPAYAALPGRLPRVQPPYAWFLRVADLPDFLRTIAPVLEMRLANSICAGYSGELKISFYRGGLRLVFDQGRLTSVENWQETRADPPAAAFPGLTFLQILFGFRSLAELRYAFPDCRVKDEICLPQLEALFPKALSDVWPVG